MISAVLPSQLRRKALLQLLLLCFVLPLCLLAARPFLDLLDWGHVTQALGKISPFQWCGALLATCASFTALGRYDVIVHKILGTNVDTRAAQASGAAAVALSQTLGFGLIIGTLARWRGLKRLNIVAASAVTILVSLSFLAAWLMIFAIAGILSPSSLPLPTLVFKASLFSAVCFVIYTALKRHITIAGFRARLPSLRAISAMMFCALIDTGCAALAFWFLLPLGSELSPLYIFPIYLTCLGVGLVSNSPGGLGPFEVTLLWALPHTDLNALLASLIAFRLVYFALPACVAALYLFRPFKELGNKRSVRLFSQGLHPETRSGFQTGSALIDERGQMIGAVARTTQTTTLLFDPAFDLARCVTALKHKANASATGILFYKCSSRFAIKLRNRGYAVTRIAQDGVLDLQTLSLTDPKRKNLRRKLRRAQKDGIRIERLELTEATKASLSKIDRVWHQENGRAFGFSIGRFQPDYLMSQAVFGAFKDDDLVAFITCHQSPDAWTLDIMRSQGAVSGGTMYALVWKAIKTAQKQNCSKFSLASTSYTDLPLIKWINKLSLRQRTNTSGLAQFKRCFAPRWIPLYASAPTKFGLCLALWDVWQEVHDPPPLKVLH